MYIRFACLLRRLRFPFPNHPSMPSSSSLVRILAASYGGITFPGPSTAQLYPHGVDLAVPPPKGIDQDPEHLCNFHAEAYLSRRKSFPYPNLRPRLKNKTHYNTCCISSNNCFRKGVYFSFLYTFLLYHVNQWLEYIAFANCSRVRQQSSYIIQPNER